MDLILQKVENHIEAREFYTVQKSWTKLDYVNRQGKASWGFNNKLPCDLK